MVGLKKKHSLRHAMSSAVLVTTLLIEVTTDHLAAAAWKALPHELMVEASTLSSCSNHAWRRWWMKVQWWQEGSVPLCADLSRCDPSALPRPPRGSRSALSCFHGIHGGKDAWGFHVSQGPTPVPQSRAAERKWGRVWRSPASIWSAADEGIKKVSRWVSHADKCTAG